MLLREITEDDQRKIGKLFSGGNGEEVLDILDRVFYRTISFTPGDTHTTAFKEGQRDLVQVLRALADITISQEK